MKYSEIEKLTRESNYSVDVPFESVKRTINEYICELKLQMNPDFQRGHVWNKEQKRAYIEYILRGGMSGRDIYFNCVNWIREGKGVKNEESNFVLVDGLQRITAIIEYLDNKIGIFPDINRPEGYFASDFDDKVSLLISLRFHVNDLQTRAEVLKWYLEMNCGGTPHSSDEIKRVQELYLNELNKN